MAKAKLSPTMTKVYEQLVNAPYYYMAEHKDGRVQMVDRMYTEEGLQQRLQPGSKLIDGTVAIWGNTSTLNALVKRGLIEIVELGGNNADRVQVVGAELQPQLKQAVRIEYAESHYSDYVSKTVTSRREVFAIPSEVDNAIKDLQEGRAFDYTITVEKVTDVELTVWDWTKDYLS